MEVRTDNQDRNEIKIIARAGWNSVTSDCERWRMSEKDLPCSRLAMAKNGDDDDNIRSSLTLGNYGTAFLSLLLPSSNDLDAFERGVSQTVLD